MVELSESPFKIIVLNKKYILLYISWTHICCLIECNQPPGGIVLPAL